MGELPVAGGMKWTLSNGGKMVQHGRQLKLPGWLGSSHRHGGQRWPMVPVLQTLLP